MFKRYHSKVNGLVYDIMSIITNTTQAQNGQVMILYRSLLDERVYAMEQVEFLSRFELHSEREKELLEGFAGRNDNEN